MTFILSEMGSFGKFGKEEWHDLTYSLKVSPAAVLSTDWRVGVLGSGGEECRE